MPPFSQEEIFPRVRVRLFLRKIGTNGTTFSPVYRDFSSEWRQPLFEQRGPDYFYVFIFYSTCQCQSSSGLSENILVKGKDWPMAVLIAFQPKKEHNVICHL